MMSSVAVGPWWKWSHVLTCMVTCGFEARTGALCFHTPVFSRGQSPRGTFQHTVSTALDGDFGSSWKSSCAWLWTPGLVNCINACFWLSPLIYSKQLYAGFTSSFHNLQYAKPGLLSSSFALPFDAAIGRAPPSNWKAWRVLCSDCGMFG